MEIVFLTSNFLTLQQFFNIIALCVINEKIKESKTMQRQNLMRVTSLLLALALLFSVSGMLAVTTGAATAADFSFIEAVEYGSLADDQKIAVISAASNTTTYTLGGDYNKSLYYSAKLGGYVAIVDADATAEELSAVLTSVGSPAEEIIYGSDINGDGKTTAGDAALLSRIIYSWSAGTKAAEHKNITDLMRLKLDVTDDYSLSGTYVNANDAISVLYAGAGLSYEVPEIEGYIIPMTSYAEADEKLYVYQSSGCPEGNAHSFGNNPGSYSFSSLEKALSLEYNTLNNYGGNYRYHVQFDKAGVLWDDAYIVVTYRTNAEGTLKYTSGAGGDYLLLEDDVSVSGGKYVRTEPISLRANEDNGSQIYSRQNSKGNNVLGVGIPTSAQADAYFYVKEIAFFPTIEDANNYIKYTKLPTGAAEGTYTSFPLYDLDTAKENLIVFNTTYINKGKDPSYYEVSLKLGEGCMGEYRFNNGQEALQIMESTKGDHRFYLAKQKSAAASLKASETYAVLLYRTNIESAGEVELSNPSTGKDAILIPDVSVSADKWVYSAPVNLDLSETSGDLFDRFYNGGDPGSPIYFDLPCEGDADYSEDQYFFLKEIIFFSNEAIAKQYIENVEAPEATEVILDEGLSKDMWITPTAISFASAEKTALNAVICDGSLTYTSDGARLAGSFAPAFVSDGYIFENHALVSLSYKTTAGGTITIGDTVVAADTSVSAGEWVYTEPLELTEEMKAAFSSDNPLAITYTGSGELYVGELVFISNGAQLDEYVSEFDKTATGSYLDGKLGEFTVLSVYSGEGLGDWSYDEDTMFTLGYTDALYDSSYRMTYKFVDRNALLTKTGSGYGDRELKYVYMRAAYKADNAGTDGVELITVNPLSGVSAVLDSDVQDTNGEWVISDPVRVPDDILNALSMLGDYYVEDYEELNHKPAVLAFTNTSGDASYAVKNIYFFETAEDAISFTMPADAAKPASTYKIGTKTYSSVTPVSAVDSTMAADSYKIYVDGTTLKVAAGSADTLATANKVAEGRVLAGDTYEDVVSVTLASTFSLSGKVSSAAATETVALKYDDRHTFTKAVAWVDSTSITSTDVITGEADVSVLKRISGETFAASATGEATVYFTDGTSVKVTVETAPLAVFMIGGQSNAEGVDGSPKTSIRSAPGQVYSSYATAGYRYIKWILSSSYTAGMDALTIYNTDVFVPKALTSTESRVGSDLSYTPDWLTDGGYGKAGIDSSVAYEWNRYTGDKVWVINVAHSGSGISSWQPGDGVSENNFWEAVGVMKGAEETLKAEIAAGHYYLTNMGYYWVQGCSDINKDAAFYNDNYVNMHEGFVEELAFDHDSDPATPDKTIEFGGIILVRRGFAGGTDNNKAPDFVMNGPRTAQYLLGNTPDDGIYMVSNVGEIFRDDASVTSYFAEKYGTTANFQALTGANYSLPTAIASVHPDIHYRQQGYNEIGREAAQNMLRITGRVTAEAADVTFNLLDADGVSTDFVTKGVTLASGATVKIVPDVAPRYMATDVAVTTSSNVTHDGYYVFKSTNGKAGTITFTCGGESVTVKVN